MLSKDKAIVIRCDGYLERKLRTFSLSFSFPILQAGAGNGGDFGFSLWYITDEVDRMEKAYAAVITFF